MTGVAVAGLLVLAAGLVLSVRSPGIASQITMARFVDEKFGFSINLPRGKAWVFEKDKARDSITVSVYNEQNGGVVMAIAADLSGEYPVQDFIKAIEDELFGELPFLKGSIKNIPYRFCNQLADNPKKSMCREYGDKEMAGRVYYTIKGYIGYAAVGVYQKSDMDMKRLIQECIESFETESPKTGSKKK